MLDGLRNQNGEVVAAFICPDSPFPYLDEYFEYLDDSYFPKIEHEELLINKPDRKKEKQRASSPHFNFDLNPSDAYRMAYTLTPQEAWLKLRRGDNIPLRKNIAIIDTRTHGDFLHFHLPGSKRMDPYQIAEKALQLSRNWRGKKIILVCPMGIRTRAIAELLRGKGVEAYSIKGGVTEWSAKNLPRWRPDICNIKDK